MGKTALSKLRDADELDKLAANIRKRGDTASANELKEQARTIRKRAIRQMKRRPKRRGSASGSMTIPKRGG